MLFHFLFNQVVFKINFIFFFVRDIFFFFFFFFKSREKKKGTKKRGNKQNISSSIPSPLLPPSPPHLTLYSGVGRGGKMGLKWKQMGGTKGERRREGLIASRGRAIQEGFGGDTGEGTRGRNGTNSVSGGGGGERRTEAEGRGLLFFGLFCFGPCGLGVGSEKGCRCG